MVVRSWIGGWTRVGRAPAIVAGVYVATFLLALPLTVVLRDTLQAHLGASMMAARAADGVNYDWWQEFTSQASGVGSTFTPAIIGFAATLDSLSSVLDAQREIVPVAAVLAAYVAAWTFLTGGILDRYARQRPIRAAGFFAASGVHFFRFLRLAAIAGAAYWWLFGFVHPWLFGDLYRAVTRDLSVERTAFLWRLAMYAAFGSLLVLVNVVFDYAKVRVVVEDRRSAVGALAAALRFILRHPGRVFLLLAANSGMFAILIAVWAVTAPGASPRLGLWAAFAAGQVYILARLALKLHSLASQTALFQNSLAHAAYTAAPIARWPDSPAAETIAPAANEPAPG